jgi:hypothetical protein
MQRLFEFAIILHPTEDQANEGVSSKLLVAPKFVLAKDQAAATLLAAREIPDDCLDKLDRVEVAVRPF